MRPRPIADCTFAIHANGTSDSPPASGLRDLLLASGARRLVTVFHPLMAEGDPRHEIVVYEGGEERSRRYLPAPLKPPFSYAVDPFVPPWPEPVDGWFAFNNLLCARGLLARRLGRARTVVYSAVDFVPDRFGPGRLTRVYDGIDRLCCLRADARWEVARPALEGRNARHGLEPGRGAPTHVVPIGAWLDRVPHAPEDGWRARRIVFIGHLVPRQGVGVLIDALALLAARGVDFSAEIAGRGPLEEELRARAAGAGLAERVSFLGFIDDHRELERMLATASVATAPYDTEGPSFTRYADPSKLKSYLAAGLPIVLTDVPPNARDLADQAGAELIAYSPEALADSLERALDSPERWTERRAAALAYARSFDWRQVLGGPLRAAGFEA